MADKKELEYLYQSDRIELIVNRVGKEPWITVYAPFDGQSETGHFFCALIPNEQVDDVLTRPGWDLSIGDGLPDCHVVYEDGIAMTEYHHFSEPGAIQPLVLVRNFHGVKPSYVEILEEFRLFHNLFHDTRNNKFIKIDDHGEEEEIIQLNNKVVKTEL